jgi:hypothetical protein
VHNIAQCFENGILKKANLLPCKDKTRELIEGEDLIKLVSLFDTNPGDFLKRLKSLDLTD